MLLLTHVPPSRACCPFAAPNSLQPECRTGTVRDLPRPWVHRVPGPGLQASGSIHLISSNSERWVRSASCFQGRRVQLRRDGGCPRPRAGGWGGQA